MQLTLASVLLESARRHPTKVAVVDGDREVAYAELLDATLRRAGALHGLGVRPGDHVALLGGNSVDFVTAYYAVLARGAVVVPVPPMLVADEVAHLLADSGARLVLAAPEHGAVAAAASHADAGSAGGRAVVLLRPGAEAPDAPDLATLAADATPQDALVLREPLDPAVLFYTSGTTGRPKGAVLTHLNLVMNAWVNAYSANELRREDVVLGCLPLFHTFGQTVALNGTLLVGGRLVLQPRFDPVEAIALMERHHVTAFLGVPTMYVALVEAARGRAPEDLPDLRLCVSGGAPLPVAVLEAFEAAFGAQVLEGYGLSETSPTASVNQPLLGVRAGSIGHAIWGVEIGVAAPDVEDRVVLLPDGEHGELVVRGHNVFAGYHENAEATAAALQDGWFRTGDLGTRDPDGTLTVVDRKKDLVLRGGYNVYPRELEEVLSHHPDVAQVAVIGVPHERHGEEVLAVVVAETGATLDGDALLRWTGERVAAHKRPRLVRVVDELPLGPSRKVLKRELRDRFADAARDAA